MFYILQDGRNDCGFACLKSLLASVNHDPHYLYLPNPKEEDSPYCFFDLVSYAEELGFNLSAYNVPDKENIALEGKMPVMVSVMLHDHPHMFMIYKVKKHYVYVIDPAIGKKKIKKNDFLEMWDGKLLKLEKSPVRHCPVKRKPLMNKKEEIITDILEIVAGLSVTSGLLFIGEKYPFYLPIIMFALFAIFEILLRSYCIHVFSNIDKRTYDENLKVKKGKLKEFYSTLEENKRYEVTINLNSIYAVISVVVISLAIASSGGYSLYYLVFGLLFAFIDVMFIEPYQFKKNLEILEMESLIGDDDIGLIYRIHQKAYRFGRISLFYRYVVLGITLFGIVLIMAMSGVISIPYIIFYLCVNIYFYKSLVAGLSMDKQIRDHRQKVIHQINLLDNK